MVLILLMVFRVDSSQLCRWDIGDVAILPSFVPDPLQLQYHHHVKPVHDHCLLLISQFVLPFLVSQSPSVIIYSFFGT